MVASFRETFKGFLHGLQLYHLDPKVSDRFSVREKAQINADLDGMRRF
jgi:hypothetical protein